MPRLINVSTEHIPVDYLEAVNELTEEGFNPLSLLPIAFKHKALNYVPVDSYGYQTLKRDITVHLSSIWPNTPLNDLEANVHNCMDHIGVIMGILFPYLHSLGLKIDIMSFHSGDQYNLKFLIFDD